jgi:hypothetical protein
VHIGFICVFNNLPLLWQLLYIFRFTIQVWCIARKVSIRASLIISVWNKLTITEHKKSYTFGCCRHKPTLTIIKCGSPIGTGGGGKAPPLDIIQIFFGGASEKVLGISRRKQFQIGHGVWVEEWNWKLSRVYRVFTLRFKIWLCNNSCRVLRRDNIGEESKKSQKVWACYSFYETCSWPILFDNGFQLFDFD